MQCEPTRPHGLLQALAAAFCTLLAAGIPADGAVPAGRYLDRATLVHDPAQLNPLVQVGNLDFSGRITVGEAVRTALSGTGYRLAAPRHPQVLALLESRLAIPHVSFESKRVDSVIGAIVGVGRGYDVQVDHVSRRIRIVPTSAAVPAPAPRQTGNRAVRRNAGGQEGGWR